jgi:transketolase
LAHSNYSIVKASRDVQGAADGGNYIYFGVREFGMTAIANGLSLHGGILPFTATFLVFSDYARNAVRMSALMKTRVVHVYTHDSIGLGEDGPTHQPIEHLASLRYIPNNRVWRPADAVESAVAWKCALERRDGPSCLAFSRQNLQAQKRTPEQIAAIARGGYVLFDSTPGKVDLIFIGTGSELDLAMQAARTLAGEGHAVRVVSMPCAEAFDAQSAEYRESVLPNACRARVAIEAAIADYWLKYVGLDGAVVGMSSFGASAPDKALYAYFGFGLDRITQLARDLLGRRH